jgi:hypothetical protein
VSERFAANDYESIRRAAWVQHDNDNTWKLDHCFRARGMEPAGCGCMNSCPAGWQERAAQRNDKRA